jgi:hypothetical protein
LGLCRGRNVDSDIGDALSKSGRRIGAADICCEGCTDLASLGALAMNAEMGIGCEGCMDLTCFGAVVATNVGMGGTGGGGEDVVGLGGGER